MECSWAGNPPSKHTQVFTIVQQSQAKIFCLQEMPMAKEHSDQLKKPWIQWASHSMHTSFSRGVSVGAPLRSIGCFYMLTLTLRVDLFLYMQNFILYHLCSLASTIDHLLHYSFWEKLLFMSSSIPMPRFYVWENLISYWIHSWTGKGAPLILSPLVHPLLTIALPLKLDG